MENTDNLGELLEILGDAEVEGINPPLKYKGRVTRNLEPEGENVEEVKTYIFFVGIPYGIAPLGPNRFKPAEPYKTTDTEYEALTCKPESRRHGSIGSEDCLYLNVYLPKKPKKRFTSLLPVLVYFHGCGMGQGDGNYRNITPDSIMKENIILVTVNYRLGVYGFLNMHCEPSEANVGLKDQVLALRWIKENIEPFGGDPRNVTICGQGVGGSCVNLHLISPYSEGLFHKAIVMSGGIYSPWGFTGHHRELMLAYKEAKEPGKVLRDVVVNSLKEACPDPLLEVDIDSALKKLEQEEHKASIHLGPSIESSANDAFIPPCKDFKDLMAKAKSVPILAGICKKEGYIIQEKDMGWVKNKEKFIRFLMVSLHWSRDSAFKQFDAIWKKYFAKTGTDDEMKEKFADFCTDLWFYKFFDNFEFNCRKYKKREPFFVYLFDFVEGINSAYDFIDEPTGAAHGDDIDFLFCPYAKRTAFKPLSASVQKKVTTMCQLWASFCKSKQPRTSFYQKKWRPHTDTDPCYLNIDNEKVELKTGQLFRGRWADLRKIIEAEDVIPPLGNSPLIPGCYEALHEHFRAALQAKDGSSNPAVQVTEPSPKPSVSIDEDEPNQEKPQSPKPGVSTDKDDPNQEKPQSPTPGVSTDKDDPNQQKSHSPTPGVSTDKDDPNQQKSQSLEPGQSTDTDNSNKKKKKKKRKKKPDDESEEKFVQKMEGLGLL